MIGIIVPYLRTEATVAAIQIANTAIHRGVDARLISLGPPDTGIHAYWDSRVWSTRGDSLYFAARGCDTLVHFQPSEDVRAMCDVVAVNAKHILVPQVQQICPANAAAFRDYDTVVCPTQGAMRSVVDSSLRQSSAVTWVQFTGGLPYVARPRWSATSPLRLCVAADTTVVDGCGSMLLQVLAVLLEQIPDLSITLYATRNWRPADRRRVREMSQQSASRFRSVVSRNVDVLPQELQAHDFVLLPWMRADFGVTAMRAFACGTPILAFDIEPFTDMIKDRCSGVLLPCEIAVNCVQAPTVVPSFTTMRDSCLATLTNRELLSTLCVDREWLTNMDRIFEQFWRKILALAIA